MKRFRIACLTAIAVGGLAITHQALADIEIRVSDGLHAKTRNDLSTLGFAAFSGKIGAFDAKIEEGIGFPALGASFDPMLDLTSIDLTSKASGTLKISLTETGFSTASAEEFLSAITGIYANSSAEMSTYLGRKDKPFGKAILLSTDLLDNQSELVSLPALLGSFSLTEVVTISAGPHSLTSIDAAVRDAPEPASVSLLGAALAMLCMLRSGWAPVRSRVLRGSSGDR